MLNKNRVHFSTYVLRHCTKAILKLTEHLIYVIEIINFDIIKVKDICYLYLNRKTHLKIHRNIKILFFTNKGNDRIFYLISPYISFAI